MNTRPIVSTAITACLLATAARAAIYPYAEYRLGEAGSLGGNNKPQDETGNGRHFSDDINGGSAATGNASFHPNATGSTAYLDTSSPANEGWYAGNMYGSLPTDNFAFGVFARAAANTGEFQADIFALGNVAGSHKIALEGNGWSATAHNVDWIAPYGGAPDTFQPDTWAHLAIIRKQGVTTFYVDGVAHGTFTGSTAHASPHLSVSPGGGSYFDGHLDEARIVHFTPDETAEDILAALQGGIVPSAFVEVGFDARFSTANLSTDEASVFRLGGVIQDSVTLTAADGLAVTAGTAPKHLIHIAQEGEIPVGTYPLISYSGSIGGLGFEGLQLAPLPGRVSGSLVHNTVDSTIDLVVDSSEPGDLTWTATGGNTWAVQGDANWNFTGTSTPAQFFPGDTVRFDETSSNKSVVVGTPVTPAMVFVTGTENHGFSGAGIAGSAGLDITGGSTVTFTNANTHSGPIYIDGSNVVVGDGGTAGTLGTGSTTLNGNLLVNRSGTITMPNAISGSGSITKTGDGRLVLSGASSFTGPVSLQAGTLVVENASCLGSDTEGTTISAGATLDVFTAGVGNEPILLNGDGVNGAGAIINSGAAGQQQGVRQLTLTSDSTIGGPNRWDVRGEGSFIAGNFKLTKSGNNQISLVQSAVSVKDIDVESGQLAVEYGANIDDSNPGSITVNGGSLGFGSFGNPIACTKPIVLNGGMITTTWWDNDGSATIASPVELAATSNTIHPWSGTTLTFNGTFSGPGSLLVDDQGTVVLTTAPAYTGDTTVTAGTLSLGGIGLADSSIVTISASGTLNLNFTGTDTVDALFIGGVQQPAGIYDSGHASGRFTGSGTLTVTTGPAATPYESWEATHGITGAGSGADSDFDGIPNGIEFVIGGDPSGPGSDSNHLLPAATQDATHFEFVFRRTTASASFNPHVEFGSDLSGWNDAIDQQDGVTIEVDEEFAEDGIDQVKVRIPLPEEESSMFARLAVEIP